MRSRCLHIKHRSDLYPVPSMSQDKETIFFRVHKLTQNKVEKKKEKNRESPSTCEKICNRFLQTSSDKQEAG